MYLTFEMIKDLNLESYNEKFADICLLKCQNDILNVLVNKLIETEDIAPSIMSKYIPDSKYNDGDVFKMSHIELDKKYLDEFDHKDSTKNVVGFSIYLDKIDIDYKDISVDEFFSLNNYRDFIIKSLEKHLEMFPDIKDIDYTYIFDTLLDVLYTMQLIQYYCKIRYRPDKFFWDVFDRFVENMDLDIGLVSYIISRPNTTLTIESIINTIKDIDFNNRYLVENFIYRDTMSYIKFDTDKLSVYDMVVKLPYNESHIINTFTGNVFNSYSVIFDYPDFINSVLEDGDLEFLKTTVRDIFLYNDTIYILPGDAGDSYYLSNGVISSNPVLEDDKFFDSITNSKIDRQLGRVMRMRNHFTKMMIFEDNSWAFLVVSQKSYFQDYEEELSLSDFLDDEIPLNRILAIVGQRDGQQYSIIRKVF